MFGINARPDVIDTGIMPVSSRTGIKVMSLNLLLPDENEAVIWRGPIIGKVITQFWEDVIWGELDYLIVDLPPVLQTHPPHSLRPCLFGIIIVFLSPVTWRYDR